MQTVLTVLITLFIVWFVTAVAVGYYMVRGLREHRKMGLSGLADQSEEYSEEYSSAVERHLRN